MGYNETFLSAIEESKDSGVREIDFGRCIFKSEVEEIVEDLRRCKFEEFTISANISMDIIKRFEDYGCEIVGMKTIKKKNGIVPAMKFKIKI